jgi:hypothetical protein
MTEHKTAKLYQAALAELRERHKTEFQDIYSRLQKQASVVVQAESFEVKTREVATLIFKNPGITRSELIARVEFQSLTTFSKVIKRLVEARLVEAPGSGRGYLGYRPLRRQMGTSTYIAKGGE